MKILLINPRIDPEMAYGKNFARLGAVMPPLGLCYLAGVLRNERYQIKILDINLLGFSDEETLRVIIKEQPDIIGLYATTLGIEAAEELAEKIKDNFPQITVVIGGPHISGYGKETLQCRDFDFGIIGEGEMSLLELVKHIENGDKDFQVLAGLVYRKGGEIIQNEARSPIQDLDRLPFPARDLLPDLRKYHPKKMFYKKLPFIHIFTSRGCPFQCVFCQTPFGKKTRFHSAEYVADEIMSLVKDFGAKEIKINDDTFNLIEERVLKIFDILKKKGIRLPWACNLRVDTVKNKDFFQAIKKRGCWLVGLGLESGNQKILDSLKKGTTLEQARQVCKWAREAGIKVQASFIIGNPLDTEETIRETIDFARSLPLHYPSFAFMTPFPGAELWHTACEFGSFHYEKFSDLRVSHDPKFIPNGLSAEKIQYLYKKAYLDAYLNPRMILRQATNISSFSEAVRLCSSALSFLGLKKGG
jgi:radical SAM superfamily enzyme YgiQ (UPF0313 family)